MHGVRARPKEPFAPLQLVVPMLDPGRFGGHEVLVVDGFASCPNPARAAEIEFTSPYVLIEGVYIVPQDSPLKTNADIDAAGVKVGVKKGSAYDLFLTRTLQHAEIVRGDEGVDIFVKEKLSAGAGVKQPVAAYAKAHPQVRLLDGRFMEIQQAMGVAKGRLVAARYLRSFIEEMKASGFVADALRRSGQGDAAIAPPE